MCRACLLATPELREQLREEDLDLFEEPEPPLTDEELEEIMHPTPQEPQ